MHSGTRARQAAPSGSAFWSLCPAGGRAAHGASLQRCVEQAARRARPGARLDVPEQRDEQRPVLLLLERHAAAAGLRLESSRPGHLQRIQAALQQLLRVLVLPRRPGARASGIG